MKKIRVRIGKDGQCTVQVEGAVGPGCVEWTKAFEQALGEVQERKLCAEYHEEPPINVTDQTMEMI